MSALLGGGHRQLFGAPATGLASAWQRAAQDEGVPAVPAVQASPARRLRGHLALRAATAAAVLAACVLPWWLAETPADAAAAAEQTLASPVALAGGA